MKRLGRIFGSLIAFALIVATLPAAAATPTGGRDFNHMTTGFPLSGGHATAPCESCHVGGVFKGTARNCDGCHAVGKRVVATPKSNRHIVTDAPCDSCHFNTSTWLGARFNHNSARSGQCTTCHNGRIASGKPAGHVVTANSCDGCHRSSAWIPAGYNHAGVVAGTCATCHNGTTATGKPAGHNTVAKATYSCDECHSFGSWYPAKYKHNTAAACSSCHNGVVAIGKPASHGAASIKGMNPCSDCHKVQGWLPATFTHNSPTTCVTCHDGVKAVGKNPGHMATVEDCKVCHTSTTTWLGALGAKPANHIPYNSGVSCGSCHVSGAVVKGPTLHVPHLSTFACTTCHLKNNPYAAWGQETKSIGHEGMNAGDDCSKSGCHRPAGNRGTSYVTWD